MAEGPTLGLDRYSVSLSRGRIVRHPRPFPQQNPVWPEALAVSCAGSRSSHELISLCLKLSNLLRGISISSVARSILLAKRCPSENVGFTQVIAVINVGEALEKLPFVRSSQCLPGRRKHSLVCVVVFILKSAVSCVRRRIHHSREVCFWANHAAAAFSPYSHCHVMPTAQCMHTYIIVNNVAVHQRVQRSRSSLILSVPSRLMRSSNP